MSEQVPSIYPNVDYIYPGQVQFNINEIKKYQFPDCIKSYFNYFEMWTPNLNGDERKILLNKLLEDPAAFSIFIKNINEPYDVLKANLIDQLTECNEKFLMKKKREKKYKRRMFKKMTKEEMQKYIRTTYDQLNTLSKERLVIKELVKTLPRKYAKKLDLENKCNTVDQVIEVLGEKMNSLHLGESEKERKIHYLKKKIHHSRHGPHSSSSSSSSSSESSSDEKSKKKGFRHPHRKHSPHDPRKH